MGTLASTGAATHAAYAGADDAAFANTGAATDAAYAVGNDAAPHR